MTLKETKNQLIRQIAPFFEAESFNEEKHRDSYFEFIREDEQGFVKFSGGFSTYSLYHKPTFGFGVQIKAVNDVMLTIAQKISLNPNPETNINTFSLGMALGTTPEIQHRDIGYNTRLVVPEDVDEVARKIIERSKSTVLPLIDKFSDIKTLDNYINNLRDFVYDDKELVMTFGGTFNIKRLIISKLSGSNNYDELVSKLLKTINYLRVERQLAPLKKENLDSPIPYTLKVLEDIEPIYEK